MSEENQPAMTPQAPAEMLLVCVSDPFEAVGDSSKIAEVTVTTADGTSAHLWTLVAVMEMNPPRTFKGWATRGSFTLDLNVSVTIYPANSGTWGGTDSATSGMGNCRVVISRGANNKSPEFSTDSAACRATERPLPEPEDQRYLNADISFEVNGAKVSAGAVAVISNNDWDHLTAGSDAAQSGMAFDTKWHKNLDPADGYASVPGQWEFALMTNEDYEKFCDAHAWQPYVVE